MYLDQGSRKPKIGRKLTRLELELVRTRQLLNVRFGSLAVILTDISLTSAIGGEAAVRRSVFRSFRLNVCFHQERSFKTLSNLQYDRPLSANCGRSRSNRMAHLCSGSIILHSKTVERPSKSYPPRGEIRAALLLSPDRARLARNALSSARSLRYRNQNQGIRFRTGNARYPRRL